ncbi:glycine receptor subunit beta-type 4-like [Octopus sinensis]|uniref:Glycine receptor subunit beta-type 4-like n=1 Tax=Octopus sinensis TaxID=2607531 RepID=A0A7E6EZL5_9MOLL|nr:glycine receptor subunit beta-type 4-like [Octopus sinensis]XP_036360850.1 glycine receptor subunit beta-type 4-like [Octopus sinensis]
MKRQENRTMETKQYATSLKWILITFNIFLHLPQCTGESNSSVWHEIMKVLKGNSYNRYFRPEKESGNITVVFVNVYVEAVGMMDSSKEMPLFLVVTETWTDKQLVPNEGSQGNLLFEERLVPLFWTPKLLLGNAGTQQDVKVYSKKIVLNPNGKLTLSYRVIFPVSCQKHINLFPLDGQICSIKIKSFYYPVEEVQVKWESNTDWQKSLDKLEIFNFDLAKIKLTEENTTQFGQNWSQIEASLHLQRKFSLQILAIYFTSTILVVVGGLSFWIDTESTAARMSLGLITLLTLITHNSSLHPAKHYFATGMLGIDIWLIICLIFVFSALIEFILLNHSRTSNAKLKTTNNQTSHDSLSMSEHANTSYKEDSFSNGMVTERDVDEYKITAAAADNKNVGKRINKADQYCKIIFPVAFIFSNIIYWMWHFY